LRIIPKRREDGEVGSLYLRRAGARAFFYLRRERAGRSGGSGRRGVDGDLGLASYEFGGRRRAVTYL